MVEKLPQIQETQPGLKPPPIASKADSYDAFAKTLGNIAGIAAQKGETFAEEASQTNLLQNQSMLSDLESNTKIAMLQNPSMASQIAEKASYSADTIKQTASLNKMDRVKFNYLSDNTMRDIKFQGAKTSFDLASETAKYSTLSAFQSTSQQIYEKLFSDPKTADILIQAQYSSLVGQVKAGILTAVEAATLHKEIATEIKRAELRGSTYKADAATPENVNALNSFQPNPQPYNNVSLPMSETSRVQSGAHITNMNAQDLRAAYASGQNVPANALMWIKSDETAISLQSYKFGAAQANGEIVAGVPWQKIKQESDLLNTSHLKLTNEQEGYRDRLNNYVLGIEKGGQYSKYIADTPDGGKAYLDFSRKNAAIDNTVFTGTKEEIANKRMLAHSENLNNLVSNVNAIGIGMDIPDQFRQPIPDQYVAPIRNSFMANSDPSVAINNISLFNDKNRAYVANAMPTPRQRLTVYETGKLIGNSDSGFLSDFWHSQQDSIDYKNLSSDESGMSNNKIQDLVNPVLTDINNFLVRQPDGIALSEASTDKAIRYVKYMALKNNDPTYSHVNDYVKSYEKNIGRAYDVVSSWSYMMDKNVIPLEKPQMNILAAHALSETYKKMAEYHNTSEVNEIISRNQPRVISSPTGRLTVVDQYGRAIADKNGHPAFDQFYSEALLRKAQHDESVDKILNYNNPFMKRGVDPYEFELDLIKHHNREGK